MRSEEIGEVIAYAPTERLKALADDALREARAEIVVAPHPSLVMARVREKVDGEVFNLGEVLTTVCEVTLDGEPGWGMVPDYAPERALCAAVLDAASRREGSEGLHDDLEDLLFTAREARRERWAGVRPTRVEFEEMA